MSIPIALCTCAYYTYYFSTKKTDVDDDDNSRQDNSGYWSVLRCYPFAREINNRKSDYDDDNLSVNEKQKHYLTDKYEITIEEQQMELQSFQPLKRRLITQLERLVFVAGDLEIRNCLYVKEQSVAIEELLFRYLLLQRLPRCDICARSYTIATFGGYNQMQANNRLPVQCSDCPIQICYQCVKQIATMKTKSSSSSNIGGGNDSVMTNFISCPFCRNVACFSVDNPRINWPLCRAFQDLLHYENNV